LKTQATPIRELSGNVRTTSAPSQAAPCGAALIALDWGTTSLRAYLFDTAGNVRESRSLPWGIMKLPSRPGGTTSAFDSAFEAACGDWLDATALPVIACGMVGSAQGWREAPYVDAPASVDALAAGLVRIDTARGAALAIVPGVIERGVLPNVMRGEETQIVGAVVTDPALGTGDALIGLPGTHAKWALARGGRIERFYTFMTGEVFAALSTHTILGRTMTLGGAPELDAFVRGVLTARDAHAIGMLATIFSSRTLGLTGQLSSAQQSDYLSGLLIGHELCGLRAALDDPLHEGVRRDDVSLLLIGETALCERYAHALDALGWQHPAIAQQATERGLWRIAQCAGLVATASSATR
jgi:2-dehydro-3-deoxygalactonokinase